MADHLESFVSGRGLLETVLVVVHQTFLKALVVESLELILVVTVNALSDRPSLSQNVFAAIL